MVGQSLVMPSQKLHPFFVASKSGGDISNPADGPPEQPGEASNATEHDSDFRPDDVAPDVDEATPEPKRRRKNPPSTEDSSGKKRRGRPRKPEAVAVGATITNHFMKNIAAEGSGTNLVLATPVPADSTADAKPLEPTNASTLNTDHASAVEPVQESCHTATSEQGPKKILKLNLKTGTIGSPPRPRETNEDSKNSKTIPKGRGKGKGKGKPSKIITIEYGEDDESRRRIANRINAILSGQQAPTTSSVAHVAPPPKQDLPTHLSKADTQSRVTHPFFLGKVQPQPTTDVPSTETSEPKTKTSDPSQITFTSTPCSPKRRKAPQAPMRMPQFGVKHLGLKVPGSKAPAWPWQCMVHIGRDVSTADLLTLPLAARKSKGNSVRLSVEESVMTIAKNTLNVPELLSALKNTDSNDFTPPPAELRLPRKHLESGTRLQKRIDPELKTRHPSLERLYDLIGTSLSAADRSECEGSSWNQKYAPTSAAEVMQSGREAHLLKEWLQALTVQSVDTGQPAAPSSSAGKSSKGEKRPKKKRKSNKLDGFVVSSEDEDEELLEVSDSEIDWSPSGRHGLAKKTVIRSTRNSKSSARLTNALVVSGPHGCGKTAAVYAVAKELGFEVFEINSSSRRSGKDVLEKIGDMTRNHLVQHHQTAKSASTVGAVDEEDVALEIESGRQATMNSFFAAKPASKSQKKPTKPATTATTASEPKKAASKHQKQSLILLEEVDILYEEDKQFWATIMGLIVQSKRPVIMTCNDETLVPLQTLNLHGILRFTHPPVEIATDCLLMIAACEGHALRREAVQSLYESRGHDLRATLTELHYWCQIGVGDRRGGFDWFYLRWPKGVDLDENNHVIRVVSEDTYRKGMGWVVHDCAFHDEVVRSVEEELLEQAWDAWQVDLGQWQNVKPLRSWATRAGEDASRQGRVASLEAYDIFAEAMSIADIASAGIFAGPNQEHLDPTVPEISDKTHDDYTVGMQLLDAPLSYMYDSMGSTMATSLKTLARQRLQHATTLETPDLDALGEDAVVDGIRAALSEAMASPDANIRRIDMSLAFDPIAALDTAQPAAYLDPSIFDRNMEMIALEVAPYVRGIVAYDSYLQEQRLKLSNLLSQGGAGGGGHKRMRKTRAAYSALEGGSRSTTRGERWFKADLNAVLVMRTGGRDWGRVCRESMAAAAGEEEADKTPAALSDTSGEDEMVPSGGSLDHDELA